MEKKYRLAKRTLSNGDVDIQIECYQLVPGQKDAFEWFRTGWGTFKTSEEAIANLKTRLDASPVDVEYIDVEL